jgi:hypothetical protein
LYGETKGINVPLSNVALTGKSGKQLLIVEGEGEGG